MADSFFTNTNMIDAQLKNTSDQALIELLEASVRRMTVVNGAYQTAVRVQRIADIVAAVPHLPLYDWYPPAMPPRKKRWLPRISKNTAFRLHLLGWVAYAFSMGMVCGYYWGTG